MNRLARLSSLILVLVVTFGCAAIPPATGVLIGASLGVVVETEKLDVTLIDAWLALRGMKATPKPPQESVP